MYRDKNPSPVLEIVYTGDSDKIAGFSSFIDSALLSFYPYINPDAGRTYKIQYSTNYYQVFYSIGIHVLSDWKNDLLKYGIMEIEWDKMITSLDKDRIFKESGGFFRVKEIDDLLSGANAVPAYYREIYPFTIRFHLKEVTFVSIQEFISRQARYYSPDEIEDQFARMTVIPESAEFTRYVLNKFGFKRFVLLACAEYSGDSWKKITDEKINETERMFAESIENYPFYGIFSDQEFTNKFYMALKNCNKNTKKNLFRK